MSISRFDKAYYIRHYEIEETRAFASEQAATLDKFIFSYLDMLQIKPQTVCDLGCGPGFWKPLILARGLEYTGVDASTYACDRYGWIKSTIQDFKPTVPFDLSICTGVLQYLSDEEFAASAQTMSKITSKALYIIVPTKRDFRETLCIDRSDNEVHKRSWKFYIKGLAPWFEYFGGGLFIRRGLPDFYPYDLWRLRQLRV